MSNIIFALTLSPSFVNSTLLLTVGIAVGSAVGLTVGVAVGSAVGLTVGVAVGSVVGLTVGVAVGSVVGLTVGVAVGSAVGLTVGVAVGSTVGVAVGVTSPTISLKLRSTFPLAVGAVTVTSYTPSAMSSMYPIVDECFDTLILSVIGAKHILSSAKSPS